MSFAPFPEGSPVSRTTPTHRRSNSLEEQISSGRSKLRRTPQSDGSCRSFGEEAQAVVNTPEALVAPEAVAAAARRRASGGDGSVMKLLAAAEDAAARDAEARAVAAARARVAAVHRAAPVTPAADASDGDGDDASERVSEATEPEAVAGRVARRDAGVAAAARLRAEQDAQAALERQVAADREAAAREVAARRSGAAPAPPPAPASISAAPRKRSGALAARWTEAVRERESEAVVRAAGFKEEAVPSDTPVGEIFRPQQAV